MVIVAAQLPATAEAESTITTLSDDAMLQDEAASEQTVAVQLWVPKMKLLPYSVTVLPAYAAAGEADTSDGAALTCNTFDALVALFPRGLEKLTLTLQLPALSTAAAATTILVALTMEQFKAATPQTAAAQTWETGMKLLPVNVIKLPA